MKQSQRTAYTLCRHCNRTHGRPRNNAMLPMMVDWCALCVPKPSRQEPPPGRAAVALEVARLVLGDRPTAEEREFFAKLEAEGRI